MRLQSVLDVVPLDNIVDVCSAHVNSDVNVDEGLFVKAVQAVRSLNWLMFGDACRI
jgi:hypothetical protein